MYYKISKIYILFRLVKILKPIKNTTANLQLRYIF